VLCCTPTARSESVSELLNDPFQAALCQWRMHIKILRLDRTLLYRPIKPSWPKRDHNMLAGRADRVLQKRRARVSSSLVDVAIGVLRSPPALLTSRWTAAAHPQQQHRRTPQPRRCHSQRSGRPVWVVAAGAASGSVTSSAVEPDYVLQLPGSSVAINVFGVEHLERQPHIGGHFKRAKAEEPPPSGAKYQARHE
jgi:hypothetical protein